MCVTAEWLPWQSPHSIGTTKVVALGDDPAMDGRCWSSGRTAFAQVIATRDGFNTREDDWEPACPGVNVGWIRLARMRLPGTKPLHPLRAPAHNPHEGTSML